jgi:hypothetical protein
MATKKKAVAGKSAQANLSGGGGQGGRSSNLKGGGGTGGDSTVKKPDGTKKK